MPHGGGGYYYFSMYLLVIAGKWGAFEIQINGEILCMAEAVHLSGSHITTVCGGASYMMEGSSVTYEISD